MKAVRLHDAKDLRVEAVAPLSAPSAGFVNLAVRAAGDGDGKAHQRPRVIRSVGGGRGRSRGDQADGNGNALARTPEEHPLVSRPVDRQQQRIGQ